MKPSDQSQPNGVDPLEERLSRTTFRQPAATWRNEILASAGARPPLRSATTDATPSWVQLLAAWFRRVPTEWTAAAALWMLIVGVNFLSTAGTSADHDSSSSFAKATPEERQEIIREALAFRRQLLGELQGGFATEDLSPADRPDADRPKRQLNFHGTNGLAAATA